MAERVGQRDQTDYQLHPEDEQDRDVGAVTGQADARIKDAPVQQQGETDEACNARRTTGVDGHALLVGCADEGLIEPVRGQQANEVPEEQEEDADVEQIAAPAQGADAQQL